MCSKTMNKIVFLFILLLSFTNRSNGFFRNRNKGLIITKNCCVQPKANVNARRANAGKDLLRQLTIESDVREEVNPENMCSLMHFLFQQAALNKQFVSFTGGMFILFDSSNQILDRLIKNRKSQPTSNRLNSRARSSLIRNLGRRSITALPLGLQKQINVPADDRYPTYGIDIPDSCLPSDFDHVIFGELPSVTHDLKYSGRRLFLKPDRFGFDRTKISSALRDINSFVKQFVKQQHCRLVHGETKSECAKLLAFKDNIDKVIYKKWKKILSKWKIDKNYQERMIKYGIREIDRQSKDLEAAGAGRSVNKFRKLLTQKYGSEDIRVRKGREIIFTMDELHPSYSTCENEFEPKCAF